MTPKTFKELHKAVQRTGLEALTKRGAEVGAPGYRTTTGYESQSWTCQSCKTVVTRNEAQTPPWSPCSCMAEAKEAAENAERERLRLEVLEAEWKATGAQPLYMGARFGNFKRRPGTEYALEACQRYAREFYPGQAEGLYLFGSPGAGKTHIATATVRAIMEDLDISPVIVTASHLVAHIKLSMAAKTDSDLAEMCKTTPLLLLDDLGNQYMTPFAQEQVYLILDARYQARRPTIITSNLDDSQLTERAGATLVSRLNQMCEPVELTATDYRIHGREA